MEANILDGIYIRIGGDAGKSSGLPIHILVSMFEHLQELIALLAKYELDTDLSPNLKEFEIELFDFKPGSAIPAIRVVPNAQIEILPQEQEQRKVVAEKFDKLMSLANIGQYEDFFGKNTLDEVKFEMAEELYGFILSAENSPISIVKPSNNKAGKPTYSEIYRVQKFTTEQTNRLLRPRQRRRRPEESEQILATIQRVGKRRKIIDLYENKDTVLAVAPLQIVVANRIYHLHHPLSCTVTKEEGTFVIQNEMLDLYAAGSTLDEAEHDLYSEFDASYNLLNSLADDQLSERLVRAKNMLNSYIREIIDE